MRRLFALLLAAGLAAPAFAAQHAGHGAAATDAAADPHAGHAMPPEKPQPQAEPHSGHPADGSRTDQAGPDPHAGHAMTDGADLPPALPPPPEALRGPAHAADGIWDPAQMAAARAAMRGEHGGMRASRVLLDRLEAQVRDGRDGFAWDADAWHGGDRDKVWLKSEGEAAIGDGLEAAEAQLLWSRAIDPWFDLQLGVRRDFGPGPDRTHAVAGLQGLAPYWFEVDGAVFLSNEGEVTARFEAEYDLRITQRLILQPRAELGLSLQDMPELRTGSGLTEGAAGVRLRYELRPRLAPYLGLEHERSFGGTADYRRAVGERISRWNFLIGLRAWF